MRFAAPFEQVAFLPVLQALLHLELRQNVGIRFQSPYSNLATLLPFHLLPNACGVFVFLKTFPRFCTSFLRVTLLDCNFLVCILERIDLLL